MSDKNYSGGVGFLPLLTLLFIGLKLTNYIDWKWWIVLCPMLIPISIVLIIFLLIIIFVLIKWLIEKWKT